MARPARRRRARGEAYRRAFRRPDARPRSRAQGHGQGPGRAVARSQDILHLDKNNETNKGENFASSTHPPSWGDLSQKMPLCLSGMSAVCPVYPKNVL